MVIKHLTDDEVQQYTLYKQLAKNKLLNIFIYAGNASKS